MSDTERLAAALRDARDKEVIGFFSMKVDASWVSADALARAIIAADPTLICPDPEAHREHECGLECADLDGATTDDLRGQR